ncbi:DsbA family protein [Acidobacteria bacterium ACD]|nr:MAG: DsbA family protein [Acidobacteriota bacterium]MCE7956400.1 DsbA family protein [Acidobacteria bacterium ACB2]MDL1949473.1 DsbA family protein [Acidobacteria bacterium ACD]
MPQQTSEARLAVDTAPSRKGDSASIDITVPVAVVVGALIVAGSVLWGSGTIGARLSVEPKGSNTAVVSSAPPVPSAPAAQQNAPDPNQRVDVSTGIYPILGKKDAKVTIVEFSDLECPFCEKFDTETFPQLKKEYIDTGKVRFAYRHYLLPFHSNAPKAAEAVACARDQGKSWELIDAIFNDQKNITVADLKKKAASLSIKSSQFERCLDSGEKKAEVDKDQSDGTTAGVSGTPTFFVNGKRLVGAQPFSQFKAVIEAELEG